MTAEPPAFYFPIQTPIANDRVKLVPFDFDLHSTALVAGTRDHPDIFAHMPSGPLDTVAAFKSAASQPGSIFSPANPACFLFAVVDTTRPRSPEDEDGAFAGIVTLLETSEVNRSTELGITLLPAFWRTHVASNAIGLLMQYAFAPPVDGGGGGLGLARVEWRTSTTNRASIGLADKIGYQRVGVIPYHYCFPRGRARAKVGNGKPLPPGSDPDDLWRDTVLYSMSWDQWKAEGSERIEALMSR